MRRIIMLGALLLACVAPLTAFAGEEVTSVTVGNWKPAEKGSVDHVKVDGEDIYLNGVKQDVKYQPGMNITLHEGKVLLVPQASTKSAPPLTTK